MMVGWLIGCSCVCIYVCFSLCLYIYEYGGLIIESFLRGEKRKGK